MAYAFNPFTGKLDQTGSGDAQVNSDWNSASGLSQIFNKPPITNTSLGLVQGDNSWSLNLDELSGRLTLSTYNGDVGNGFQYISFQDAGTSPNARFDIYQPTYLPAQTFLDGVQLANLRTNTNNSFTAGQTITAAANTSALTASYSVTGSNTTPLLNLTGTWNTTGVARGILLNITDTASNTQSRFLEIQRSGISLVEVNKYGLIITNQATLGFTQVGFKIATADSQPVLKCGNLESGGAAASFGFALGTGGSSLTDVGLFRASSSSFKITNGSSVGAWGKLNVSSVGFGASSEDTILARDAANTLAQRNGTNAQAFRLYNTFTDASNYERGFMRWNTNTLEIGTEKGGTGVDRYMALVATAQSGGQYITWIQGTSTTATQGPSLNFVTSTTQGSSFSQIYAARVDSVTADLGLRGRLIHIGSVGTGFVGTSAFPALKRSSTTLQVRLADDSAFAPIQGKITTETAYTATTITPTGFITLYDSTGTAYKVACSL
jgi:hypothetical protein